MPGKLHPIIKVPLFFFFFISVGLAFGYLTFKVLSYSRIVEVPSLRNMTLIEANNALSGLNLYLKIEGESFDSSIAAGRIIQQSIPAGNKVKEKRSIKVLVSKGPRLYSVPFVVNEPLRTAEEMILQKGLKIGKVLYVRSDLIEQDRIVAQKPEPDDPVSDSLTVLVSLGPHRQDYYCPNLVDRDIERAKETAEKIGLKLDIQGTGEMVKTQSPEPGELVKTGDTIQLTMRNKVLFEIIRERLND